MVPIPPSRLLALLPLLLLICAPALGQPVDLKWGDVPAEHLAMREYPADTSANVLILADVGETQVSLTGDVVFKRHVRIKILREAGYEWATIRIPYYAKDRSERVRSIKGQTFVPRPDGSVERHKMDKDAVMTEDINGSWKREVFTLPALEPGAVVEYQYTLNSERIGTLPSWTFQHGEPTLWSEINMSIPEQLHYVVARKGFSQYAVNEHDVMRHPEGDLNLYRMAMAHVPALRDEPFTTTTDDYRAQVSFQLSSWLHPRLGHQSYLKTWDELARDLRTDHEFGIQADPARAVRARAEALTEGIAEPRARLRALYDFVQREIVWDERYRWFAQQDVADVLEKKSGSSGEINLLFVALARAAGFQADPVVLSSRSNGQVVESYPILNQFNYAIAAVELDGEQLLIDATSRYLPMGTLPVRALNQRGWRVGERSNRWIDVSTDDRGRQARALTARLVADGRLVATVKASDGGYYGAGSRETIADDGEEAFVRDRILDDLDELEITSYSVSGVEHVDSLLATDATFELPAYAAIAGDMIYVNPIVLDRSTENALRSPERTYPVDMAYRREHHYSIRLEIPDGYEIVEAPSNTRIRPEGGGGMYVRRVSVEDGVVELQTRYVTGRTVFPARQYPALRSFFDAIVEAEAESVVLRRVADETAAAGGE